jgi:RNA methyltransferase, TrmH family
MLSVAEIKRIRSLSVKKFRRQSGLFCVEGEKMVSELILSGWGIEMIYATEEWKGIRGNNAVNLNIKVISGKELERISTLTTPNKVLALAKVPLYDIKTIDAGSRLILALDNIQDPGNLGTIIRTADWFGVEEIVCSSMTADVYNPKVIQATMGSFLRVKIYYTDLTEFLESIPDGIPVIGATLDGENINKKKLPGTGILVTGNESKGISEKIMNRITNKVYIPMFDENNRNSKPESLNVAVAWAGILLSKIQNSKSFQPSI